MKLIYHLLIYWMCLMGSVVAQNSSSAKLLHFSQQAVLFNRNFTQEKVYLHFDNTGYFLGETIWFKAYVVNATSITPTDMSKTLYVELLTQEGDLLERHLVKINNGVGSGNVFLPDSLPGGFYEIRAYTRSMRNFGNDVIFSRVFPVYSKPAIEGEYSNRNMIERRYSVLKNRENSPSSRSLNLTFFPEGGSLVSGLTSRVAFKATDKDGQSVDVSGTLVDEKNKKIVAIQTTHQGMGSFEFTPTSKSYKANVLFNGKQYAFELPKADTSGYTLHIKQTFEQDSMHFKLHLQRTDNIPEDSLAVSLMCRGQLLDFRMFTIPKGGLTLTFPSNRLMEGVNQLTLYASDGRVLSDRLFYVKATSSGNKYPTINGLTVSTDKNSYDSYQKITLKLQAHDTTSTNTGTSISLAVRDAASSNFAGPDVPNIATTLLLGSDLKGYIVQPRWYFESDDQLRRDALDLLMLTQGWRRYKWERMEGLEPFIPNYPIEEGILIDGEVQKVLSRKPAINVDLKLWMTRGTSSQQATTRTDSLGWFSLLIPELYDEWQLNMLTSIEKKTKDFRILLHRQFAPTPRSLNKYDKTVWINTVTEIEQTAHEQVSALLGEQNYVSQTNDNNTKGLKEYKLKEVEVTAKKPMTNLEHINLTASVNINIRKELEAAKDEGGIDYTSILDYLKERFPRLFFVKDGLAFYKMRIVGFRYITSEIQLNFSGTHIYNILDEDDDLQLQDIERIVINEDLSIMDIDNINGDPLIYLFIKKDFDKEPMGVRSTPIQGYTLFKEFYSPVYPAGQPILDSDYRRTLYWNPDIILDKEGKASVEFYNNQSCRRMTVSAEGITSNGVLLLNK